MKRIIPLLRAALLCAATLCARAEGQPRLSAFSEGNMYRKLEYAEDGTCASLTEYETRNDGEAPETFIHQICFDAAGNIISAETNMPGATAEVLGEHTWRLDSEGITYTITYTDTFREAETQIVIVNFAYITVRNTYGEDGMPVSSETEMRSSESDDPEYTTVEYTYAYDDAGLPLIRYDSENGASGAYFWETE